MIKKNPSVVPIGNKVLIEPISNKEVVASGIILPEIGRAHV